MNHIFFIKLYSGSILLLNSRIYINIRLKELFEIDFQRERTMLIIHLCIYTNALEGFISLLYHFTTYQFHPLNSYIFQKIQSNFHY